MFWWVDYFPLCEAKLNANIKFNEIKKDNSQISYLYQIYL